MLFPCLGVWPGLHSQTGTAVGPLPECRQDVGTFSMLHVKHRKATLRIDSCENWCLALRSVPAQTCAAHAEFPRTLSGARWQEPLCRKRFTSGLQTAELRLPFQPEIETLSWWTGSEFKVWFQTPPCLAQTFPFSFLFFPRH